MRKSWVALVMTAAFLFGLFGLQPLWKFLTPEEEKYVPYPEYTRALAEGKLADVIKTKSGVDPKTAGTSIANPLENVSADGVARFAHRGLDIKRLAQMRAVLITGEYCGASSVDFVNTDSDTLIVVGSGFISHGDIYSTGPVIAAGDAHFMGAIVSSSLVWCMGNSFPRGLTVGQPLVVSNTADYSQMDSITKDIWHGDYGLTDVDTGPAVPRLNRVLDLHR